MRKKRGGAPSWLLDADDLGDATILQRRIPVWCALSDFWLDTKLDERDLASIARIIDDAGYDDAKLERILYGEVALAVGANFLQVAGEWAGFDQDWLTGRILEIRRGRRLAWLLNRRALFYRRIMGADWERFLQMRKKDE